MKPSILIIQLFVLLLASSGGGESATTGNWVCYDLVFGPDVDSPLDGLPLVDEPVMFGRLAFPMDKLPLDALQSIEGRISLEPEEDHEHLHRWRGQNLVRIFTDASGRIEIVLRGITTHNLLSLSQFDGTFDSFQYFGAWADVLGWGPPKSGMFAAELVPAYSLSNCMSMK